MLSLNQFCFMTTIGTISIFTNALQMQTGFLKSNRYCEDSNNPFNTVQASECLDQQCDALGPMYGEGPWKENGQHQHACVFKLAQESAPNCPEGEVCRPEGHRYCVSAYMLIGSVLHNDRELVQGSFNAGLNAGQFRYLPESFTLEEEKEFVKSIYNATKKSSNCGEDLEDMKDEVLKWVKERKHAWELLEEVSDKDNASDTASATGSEFSKSSKSSSGSKSGSIPERVCKINQRFNQLFTATYNMAKESQEHLYDESADERNQKQSDRIFALQQLYSSLFELEGERFVNFLFGSKFGSNINDPDFCVATLMSNLVKVLKKNLTEMGKSCEGLSVEVSGKDMGNLLADVSLETIQSFSIVAEKVLYPRMPRMSSEDINTVWESILNGAEVDDLSKDSKNSIAVPKVKVSKKAEQIKRENLENKAKSSTQQSATRKSNEKNGRGKNGNKK